MNDIANPVALAAYTAGLKQLPVADPGFAGLGRRESGARGTVLYHEGQQAREVFLIRRGMVKLMLFLPDGRSRIVRMPGPGAVLALPEITTSANGTYRHTAVALRPVEFVRVGAGAVLDLRQSSPGVYLELLERVYADLDEADRWIMDFATGAIDGRVIRLIRHLASLEADQPAGHIRLPTCQEMGEVLGVTAESVSRVVARLKRLGALAPVRGAGSDRYVCCFETLARSEGGRTGIDVSS